MLVEVLVEALVTFTVSSLRTFGRMVVFVSCSSFSSFVAVVSVVDDSELADDWAVVVDDFRMSMRL